MQVFVVVGVKLGTVEKVGVYVEEEDAKTRASEIREEHGMLVSIHPYDLVPTGLLRQRQEEGVKLDCQNVPIRLE